MKLMIFILFIYIFDDYNINLNDFSFKIIKIINKKGILFSNYYQRS